MWVTLVVVLDLVALASSQIRLCEVSGDCRLCADRRYSYYRCNGQSECFPTETCDGGFCCPLPKPILALQNEMLPQVPITCGPNEQFSACHSPCQSSCGDPMVPPCPSPVCQPGCHCMPGYLRKDGSPRSLCVPRDTCVLFDVTAHCADDRRQYQGCGSACPISCQNRNSPRCHERCISGCFCRVPYILENGADPLHSRCILPSECPLESFGLPTGSTTPRETSRSYTNQVQVNLVRSAVQPAYQVPYPPTPNTATVVPNTNRCADPLKNYLSCGTKCPVGCNALKPPASCSLQCVPGCFCHAPYILLDATDPQSGCVLPQYCPKTTSPEIIPATCSDPRKEWTSCGALNCARSCSNLLGLCGAGNCSPGCICREPYVLQDVHDPNSRCVLPSECSRKCEDPNKEFLTCGSSCPVGCDNRHPKSCTPCLAGCFCRNGLVAMNSSSWQTSECVRLEDCSGFIEETPLPTETTTTEEAKTVTPSPPLRREPVEATMTTLLPLSPQCPVTTLDVGGRSCDHDTDCPTEQRCCRALIATLGISPQRCACKDPLAVWSSCGSLCPEYCSQPAVPVCSTTCNPGCQCAAGYVRARNDVTAPCIPREACPQVPKLAKPEKFQELLANIDGPRATIREIVEDAPQDPFTNVPSAVANLRGVAVSGKFSFNQLSRSNLKISGTVQGLEPGQHAIVLHQFGDISNDCMRIGPPFLFMRNNRTPSLGDISGAMVGNSEFSRVVDWPVTDVIGRSIAIYRFSTEEWQSKAQHEKPIACATIGVSN